MKDLKYYLYDAIKKGYAVGAFNFTNMESLQGIASAAEKTRSPVILSVSEGALQYMGDRMTFYLFHGIKKSFEPFFLHLDHGKSFNSCKLAIDAGFDSVMIDGSDLPFEENVKLTKRVVKYAHARGLLVEGELGVLKGIEDNVSSATNMYTNPEQAKLFVDETGVDSLAIAIGTSHGAYKYVGKQELKLDILEEIEKILPNFPIVLHGASNVNNSLIERINKNGGKIEKAVGINEDSLREIITKHNVAKINCDTDLRLAMTGGVREALTEDPTLFDPRKYLGRGKEYIEKLTIDKMENLLMSKNKR